MSVSFAQIPVGSVWPRKELATLWGYQSFHAIARGVVTPAEDKKIILFVTQEKQASATDYKDVLRADILEWEGPNDHFAERRMLVAKEKGEEIHLFHRDLHHTDFTYLGQLQIVSVDLRSNMPSKFVFEVVDASRKDWTHDQLLAAFFLYLQVKPSEIQEESQAVSFFARSTKKPNRAVAAKLRAFTQLDPVLSTQSEKASDNVTALDKTVWDEFQNNWTGTTLMASEAYESVVGTYESAAEATLASAADAAYLYKEGESKEAIVQVRKNQYLFRKAILNSYDSTCCITELKNERLLIASHVVPWAEDKRSRLNPENGLCLSALHDRAYDQGLITVLPSNVIRINQRVLEERDNAFLHEALLQYEGTAIRLPGRFQPDPKFLEHHARRFGFID